MGYVASEITKAGGIAILAAIAPYTAVSLANTSEVGADAYFFSVPGGSTADDQPTWRVYRDLRVNPTGRM